ncbi:OLC1v1030320C1 [Oldenlandia corymbosa var. corymbosa]|uniref:OLC1v1030320C1 n=1 Tax=Oldenlandia corymbosa var. corymbosa TaxID=529605 RepID=A0AAV1CHR6_OLDCO|nr:OLC1v1030320C1 [Oldenlandia corymbosa var. corymbosa]
MEKVVTRVLVFQLLNILLLFVITCLSEDTMPASFVFGDSIVDVGNNNYIVSLAKANYPPHGVDLGRATGRFTNGKTIADIVGEELGFIEFTPPFLAPNTTSQIVLKGVNYASAAVGILNETGMNFVGRISFDARIENFAKTRQYIMNTLGESRAMTLLSKALLSVTIGSNDFINNYLIPVATNIAQTTTSPTNFVAAMISRYRIQLMRLYNMGARKIIVVNVAPVGCIPSQRELYNLSTADGCAAFPNQLAQMFNNQLRILVSNLSTSFEESDFVYADAYRIVYDLIQNYSACGFDNADSSCCHLAGRFGDLVPCTPASEVCEDRSKYVFWDTYHPTEAANLFIAKRLLDGDSMDIWPKNIRHLISSSS